MINVKQYKHVLCTFAFFINLFYNIRLYMFTTRTMKHKTILNKISIIYLILPFYLKYFNLLITGNGLVCPHVPTVLKCQRQAIQQ